MQLTIQGVFISLRWFHLPVQGAVRCSTVLGCIWALGLKPFGRVRGSILRVV